MAKNFRDAVGTQPQWIDTRFNSGFSNFLFVDNHYGSDPVVRRVFSLARKHDYQSLLIEIIPDSECELLVEENENLRIRRPDFRNSIVHRLSFFLSPKGQNPSAKDFLGYMIFKRDFFANNPKSNAHVFESVISPVRSADHNNFIHCCREYAINTTAGQFHVTGVLYAQQNNLTFVCAHVGLRAVLACVLPEGDISYSRINKIVGVDHKVRRVGDGGGLEPSDIERVFAHLGVEYEKIVHEPKKKLMLKTEYQRDLYSFIESGWPALVAFELDGPNVNALGAARHIIPVLGHTFNEDTWLPDAQRSYFGGSLSYYPSENWLSSFAVHDDNFGPYLCVPRHFLKKDNFRLLYGLKRHKTQFSAVEAEAIGADLLTAISRSFPVLKTDWYDRFAVFAKCGWLVLRTVLVEKKEYLKHLQSIRSREGVSLESDLVQGIEKILPGYFWMVEASAPELFATSRCKFGEVLISADKPLAQPLDVSILIAARLPGMVLLGGTLAIEKTKLIGHTKLFHF